MLLNKNYIAAFLVYFFLIYGITLDISGVSISSFKIILLSTFVLFIVSSIKRSKIDTTSLKYGLIVLPYLLYVMLYLYPFGIYQDYLVRNGSVLYFLVFISSIYLAKNFFIKLSENDFLRIIFFTTVAYSIVIVLMVLSDELKGFIYSIIKINKGFLETGGQYRITAPNALWGASFSVVLLVGMISGMVISRPINKYIYYSSLIIILIAIANVGRSGLFIFMGHDNLSMFKNLLKYRHESKKQVCNSFTYFRGQI